MEDEVQTEATVKEDEVYDEEEEDDEEDEFQSEATAKEDEVDDEVDMSQYVAP